MEYDNFKTSFDKYLHLKEMEELKENIKTLKEIVSTQRQTIEAHEETIKHLRRE